MSCCDHDCTAPQADHRYRRILWVALTVNLAMFGIEIAASIVAGSVSLRARTALLKGAVMGLFGLWVAASTVHHAIAATVPHGEIISGVGFLALAANLCVAALLYRYRATDSQALSVWLCTRNDCIANIAVMAAGAGVWFSGTPWPDIAVAAIIACLGLSSAARVIRQARHELRARLTLS